MEMGWCEQYEMVMYFNEGGRTAFFGPLGGLCGGTGLGMSCCQKSAPMNSPEGLPNNSTVQRCVKKEAKKIVWAQLGKAWRAMCTVEDKTGIPLPGCAIGSARARWA